VILSTLVAESLLEMSLFFCLSLVYVLFLVGTTIPAL